MYGNSSIRKSFLYSFQCVSWGSGSVYCAVAPLWCSPKHYLISHDHTCSDVLRREAVAGYPVRVTADVKLSYRVSPVTRKSVQKRPVVRALFILSEMIFTCLMLQGALQHDLQFTLLLQWVLWFPLVSFLLSPFYFRVFSHSLCWCSSWKKNINSTFFLAWASDNMSKSVVPRYRGYFISVLIYVTCLVMEYRMFLCVGNIWIGRVCRTGSTCLTIPNQATLSSSLYV